MKTVDIIIPALNQVEYTKKCLVYLQQNTRIDYRIIFIDNASTDGTAEFVKNFCKYNQIQLKLIKNKKNKGVAISWNQGIKASNAPYVAIINNDIITAPNWLSSMVNEMENDEDIWASCPVFTANEEMPNNFPNNIQLRNTVKECEKFIGFCFVLSRKCINEIGLFDEQFRIGWFEDTSYWCELVEAEHPPMTIGNSYIHHFGSQTIKHYKGFSKYQKENQEKFIKKYSGTKEQTLARLRKDKEPVVRVENTIIEQKPKEIMLSNMYKISVPDNFTPEQNSKIEKGEYKLFSEIPEWARNNTHYLIQKIDIEFNNDNMKNLENSLNIKMAEIRARFGILKDIKFNIKQIENGFVTVTVDEIPWINATSNNTKELLEKIDNSIKMYKNNIEDNFLNQINEQDNKQTNEQNNEEKTRVKARAKTGTKAKQAIHSTTVKKRRGRPRLRSNAKNDKTS